jgi:ABC-type branched-subunit amino acid transport system substrate-binding protein
LIIPQFANLKTGKALRAKATLILWMVYSGLSAQNDTVYHIGLILPFQTTSTAQQIDDIVNAHDLFTANHVHFDEDAILSLNFYQGLMLALNQNSENVKTDLQVYDNWDSDSVTAELLKKPEMKKLDFIIGSVSSASAKLIAEFCKANSIYNIQPFTPSKGLTSENPYHLKLAPTIDAHVDNLFQSILDSFPDANIIIYTLKNERSLPLAQRFDTLFKAYNASATAKYPVAMINSTDLALDSKKNGLSELIKPGKTNVLIITSYDEPFIQSTLRTVNEKNGKDNIVVYGLPTWLNGDILRLDYINDLHTRISDAFWADSTRPETCKFIDTYKNEYNATPARFAYLGFDVMNFMMHSLKSYGKDFLPQIVTQRYTGVGYKFDITPSMKNQTTTNYFENTHVNVFKVDEYQLKKVW